MSEKVVSVAVKDGVATRTTSRPSKRNAMSDGLLAVLDGFFRAPRPG